jgi:class 3 adenylate cyclase
MTEHTAPPLGDTLERAIGAAAISGLRRDANYLDELIAAGVVEARFATADPAAAADPVGLIRDLGRSLGDALHRDPTLAGTLGIDSLGLLRSDAVGPAGRMASAPRRQRTIAVAALDPVSPHVPVAEVARSRQGSLIRCLGGVHLLAFDDGEHAVRALLDLRDAAASPDAVRAGAEAGEVASPGSDVFGPVVAGACRVVSVADPGEILVAASVRDPLGDIDGVTLGFVAPREVDDAPMVVWSVSRAG